MNPRLLLSLTAAAVFAATPAIHARDSDVARNVIIGTVAGAIIGDAHSNRPGEGAVLGAAAGLLFTAVSEGHRNDHRYSAPPPPCDRRVVVSAPCAPTRVVIARPAPPCDDRRVVVVRPTCPPPRVVVIDSRRDRHDHNDRYDNRRGRDDRRSHDRRDRNDRDDRHDRSDYDRYASNDRR